MKNITHIFFDLDHTLWDTDKNSEESLSELFHELELQQLGIPSFKDFHLQYRKHNQRLWGLYAENQIGKEAVRLHRFVHTFQDFNVHDQNTALNMADKFVERTPYKLNLIDGAKEILIYLQGRYNLSIITNGFSESQYIKMNESGLTNYFDHIFISEEIGINKPDPSIFHYAANKSGAKDIRHCLMIGDTYQTDIMGAINAGMQSVFLSSEEHSQKHTDVITIKSLIELTGIL